MTVTTLDNLRETISRSEIDPSTGEPRCAHIVAGDDKHTGIELVMKARIDGTMVEALCGHRWIPERDPRQYPMCSKCKDIYDAASEATGQNGRDPWDIKS